MVRSVEQLDLSGKRVFVRVDFNVPIDKKTGAVKDDSRIRAALPTIRHAIGKKAKVILASHLGRPDGKVVPELSLENVGARLSQLLGQDVIFADDCVGDGVRKLVSDLREGQVLLLENLRFHPEEERNDEDFARQLASLAEAYINDAFGTAHRAHASTVGMVKHVPQRGAGFLMLSELKHLQPLLKGAQRPYLAILGGAKVSDKIKVIENLMARVDALLIGGAMAYTFMSARGIGVGASRVEKDKLDLARRVLDKAKQSRVELVLPVDHVVAREPKGGIETRIVAGTRAVAQALAKATARGATTVVGGGDSAAAIVEMGLADKVTHVSTGGGASLEFLEGRELPGVKVLDE